MSGLEVLSQPARRTRSRTELPVIMVTARTEGADIVEAFRLGANDYVTKPIDFPVALARIGTHLSHKWAVEDLRESEERYALAVQRRQRRTVGLEPHHQRGLLVAALEGDARLRRVARSAPSPEEWLTRVHHDDVARVESGARTRIWPHGSGHYESEHRILHRNGTFRWVLLPRRGGPERRRARRRGWPDR